MKKIKLLNFAFFALLGALVSCNDDEDATQERGVKPVITAGIVDFSVTEGETVTVNLTSDMAYNKQMDLKLELVGGTGSFRDYVTSGDETILDDGYGVIGHKITFPAYSTSASFDITPLLDFEVEGTETFEFRLYGMGNANGIVAGSSEMITVTVANGTSDDVEIVVDWSQTYTDSFGSLHPGEYLGDDDLMHEYCDYDFDLEVYDGAFGYFDTSYSSCPEQVTIPGSAPDDTYYIVPSLWELTGTTPAEDMTFDVKVTVAKPGVWKNEIHMFNWNTVDGGAQEGNPDAYVLSHVLIKTGTTYELYDENFDLVASGRGANVINRIPKKISK